MSEVVLRDKHSAPLNCTNCAQVVTVSIDRHATGNLTIVCTNCGHEHYRYCENGVITEGRWRSSARMVPYYYYSTTASTSTCTYGTGSVAAFAMSSWHNTDASTNSW